MGVHAVYHLIDDHAADIAGDQRVQGAVRVSVDGRGTDDDKNVDDEIGGPHRDVFFPVEPLGHDVDAAGGAPRPEQQAVAGAHHDAAVQRGQQHLHRESGQDGVQNIQKDGIDHRGIDGFIKKLTAHGAPAKDEQGQVEHDAHQTDGQLPQIVDHQRHAGHAAQRNV